MKTVVIRLDDVGHNDAVTNEVIANFAAAGIPVTCAVVPKWLSPRTADVIRRSRELSGGQLELIQHGFAHENHAPAGERRYEFGASRSGVEQLTDIRRGREIMLGYFGESSAAGFSPPHDRLSQATVEALDESGFHFCTGGPLTFKGLSIPKGIATFTCDVDGSRRQHSIRRARRASELLACIETSGSPVVGVVLHALEFACHDDFADVLRALSARLSVTLQFTTVGRALAHSAKDDATQS